MKAAMFATCPRIRGMLDALAEDLSSNYTNSFPVEVVDDEQKVMRTRLRINLSGASFAVIGIGNTETEIAHGFRTAVSASHSHECVLVLTHAGLNGFVEELNALTPIDRDLVLGRIRCVVYVDNSPGMARHCASLFPSAKPQHQMCISELECSGVSRERVVNHIRAVFAEPPTLH